MGMCGCRRTTRLHGKIVPQMTRKRQLKSRCLFGIMYQTLTQAKRQMQFIWSLYFFQFIVRQDVQNNTFPKIIHIMETVYTQEVRIIVLGEWYRIFVYLYIYIYIYIYIKYWRGAFCLNAAHLKKGYPYTNRPRSCNGLGIYIYIERERERESVCV